jgi:hypothetical protein
MTGEQTHGATICALIVLGLVGVPLLGCAVTLLCAALVGGHDTFDPDVEAAIVEALDTVAPPLEPWELAVLAPRDDLAARRGARGYSRSRV